MSAAADSVSIDPMRWWHIATVAALESDLFPADPWSTEQFWQELAHDNRVYVVLIDDADILGYGGVMVNGSDGDIQTIAVRPDRQGTGNGRALLAALLDAARERGASDVMLEVRADNVAAIALYDAFGFERLTTRRNYYPDGSDALVMRVSIRQRHTGGPE